MAGRVKHLLNRGGRYYARMVVPELLRPFMAGKTELRVPLGADRRTAIRELPRHVSRFHDLFAQARRRAVESGAKVAILDAYPLTPRQLAVRHYMAELAFDEDCRADPRYSTLGYRDEHLAQLLRKGIAGSLDDDELEQTIGVAVAKYQRLGHLNADKGTTEWRTFARALCAAEFEAMSRAAERDEGDYGGRPAHPLLEDLSEPDLPDPVDLERLWDDYVAHRQQLGSMKDGGRRQRLAVKSLIRFVGHRDALRLTKKDILNWRDELLRSMSPSTVGKVYLPTVRAVLRWAADSDRLPETPAAGVRQSAPKIRRAREAGYTNDEANRQLSACVSYMPAVDLRGKPIENPRTTAAKRWVPLLCAFTGARISEITQLRRQDVREEGDYWILRITPDAGTVKTNIYRDIPLHRQLIELGFLDYLATIKSGPLFHMSPDASRNRQHARKMTDRLRDWLHSEKLVPGGLQPCHGWRHRFKTVGLELGVAERVIDCIQGHASRTAGESYGDVTMRTKAEAINRYPSFDGVIK